LISRPEADYSERRSPDAQFAAQLDKIEALLQAIEYGEAGSEAHVSFPKLHESKCASSYLDAIRRRHPSAEGGPERGVTR